MTSKSVIMRLILRVELSVKIKFMNQADVHDIHKL